MPLISIVTLSFSSKIHNGLKKKVQDHFLMFFFYFYFILETRLFPMNKGCIKYWLKKIAQWLLTQRFFRSNRTVSRQVEAKMGVNNYTRKHLVERSKRYDILKLPSWQCCSTKNRKLLQNLFQPIVNQLNSHTKLAVVANISFLFNTVQCRRKTMGMQTV